MNLKTEIENLSKYGFSQKEIVENLLDKGYAKNVIKANMEGSFKKMDTNVRSTAFAISFVGQILIMALFFSGISTYFSLIFVVIALIILTIGYCKLNKIFILIWIVIFSVSIVFWLTWTFMGFSGGIQGQVSFAFALLSSIFARKTFEVYKKINSISDVYDFEE